MDASTRMDRGFTRVELFVTVVIVFVVLGFLLANLAVVDRVVPLVKGQLIQCMCHARDIHMATMSMACDGKTNKDAALGWPGDLKASGRIATLGDFANVLVRRGCLKPGDLKIFSGPGFKPYKGTLSSGSNGVLVPPFTEENCAYKIYLVKESDPSNTVFLVSKNYRYNSPLNDPKTLPFGDRGLVVLRKGGDAAILKKSQAQTLQVVGQLPGGGSVESAENCLNPGPTAP